tara:strand:+ start:3049 stop:3729 length:681 start_codon:yes stop_codon:yes gene_type:complete
LQPKDELKRLRMKYKESVHMKPTMMAFRDATITSDQIEDLGETTEQALTLAGKWLLAHAKGPSVDDWTKLLRFHTELVSRQQPSPVEAKMALQVTYFLLVGIKKWEKKLKDVQQVYDKVIVSIIPVLSHATHIPHKARLLLIHAAEDVFGGLKKTDEGRFRLAELRMHKAILLSASDEPSDIHLALTLLQQQLDVFTELSTRQHERAKKRKQQTEEHIKTIQVSHS